MECYGLNRFSEDIDLDSTGGQTILKIIDTFCNRNGYTSRVAKNTETVKRIFIHYEDESNDEEKPLKIEISYRSKEIPKEITCIRNGILVYDINYLTLLKNNAFNSRNKIRDLYDLTFIYNHYKDNLQPYIKETMTQSIQHKGLEYFDYITENQKDDLIDKDNLTNDFLKMYFDMGLLKDTMEELSEEKDDQEDYSY